MAGLGNIYVCEALYRARISPLTPAGKVSRPRLETLAAVIRDVLNDAIAAGGSTLKDFANVEGGQGYFQHRFDVYGREGAPCLRDGCGGVVEGDTIVLQGDLRSRLEAVLLKRGVRKVTLG